MGGSFGIILFVRTNMFWNFTNLMGIYGGSGTALAISIRIVLSVAESLGSSVAALSAGTNLFAYMPRQTEWMLIPSGSFCPGKKYLKEGIRTKENSRCSGFRCLLQVLMNCLNSKNHKMEGMLSGTTF